jgi:hypothetical protein
MRCRTVTLFGAAVLSLAAATALLGAAFPTTGARATGPAAPDDVLGPVAALAAWLVAVRLAVGTVVAALAVHRVASSRWHRAAAATAPTWLRRAVATALGAGLAGAMLAGSAAAVGEGTAGQRVTWTADRPSADPVADHRVLVRTGDSLWRIAASRLGPRASVGDVAAAWPRWYAANRARIGPDPDLVRPGQRLRPPPG